MSKLDEYLNQPVSALIADSPRAITEEEQERHKIYALLLMSMVTYNWNGNKRGIPGEIKASPQKDYGNNPLLSTEEKPVKRGKFLANDYLGHNIAAIAVDRDGYIIDFDFNHNEIFNSSTQHAEARLLNRIFSLNQINDSWNIGVPSEGSSSYGQLLQGVTVYTSLESCAQCSGIMTLGNAKEVVYLQEDPGQYKIGNIMFRLTESADPSKKALAPRPISAQLFNFHYCLGLAEKFEEFKETQKTSSITSFLCTESAYLLFLEAESEFQALLLTGVKHPEWKLNYTSGQQSKLSNKEVLEECIGFYRYVTDKGRRGTPH